MNIHMPQRSLVHWFATHHDDVPAFHAGYLVLTFMIAALLNLGVFVILIALHIAFDIVKYRSAHGCSWSETIYRALRESIVDIALLFVALVAVVYLHEGTGIIVLGGFLRAEATIARALFTVLPKFSIIGHTLPSISAPFAHEPTEPLAWTSMERISLMTICIALVMLLTASSLTADTDGLQRVLIDQLLPWRW